MAEAFQLPIPMWRVQYHLLGGHRRMVAITAVYAAVLAAGGIGLSRLMRNEPPASVAGWILSGLSVIQILVVVLGGCNSVYRAMLRDYESRMIESHRLTPMSDVSVAVGYLFGSTLQILLLFLVNLTVGAVAALLANIPVGGWIAGNLLLLSTALMLWAMFVFAGMRLAKPSSPAAVLLGIGLLGIATPFVPGAGLILGVFGILMGFWVSRGATAVADLAILIAVVVHGVMTFFWVYVAAAKYRRPDLPALNALRGLVLLALWLVIAFGGIHAFQQLTQTRMVTFRDVVDPHAQWICTLVGSLIVATIALSGAVMCRRLVTRGGLPRDWSDRVSDFRVAVRAAVMIGLLAAVVGAGVWPDLVETTGAEDLPRYVLQVKSWLWTLAACVVALMAVRGVLRFACSLFKSPGIPVALFIIVAWAAPPVADSIRAAYTRDFMQRSFELSWLLGCSPIGIFMEAWAGMGIVLWPGLLVQLALALGCTWVGRRAWTSTRPIAA